MDKDQAILQFESIMATTTNTYTLALSKMDREDESTRNLAKELLSQLENVYNVVSSNLSYDQKSRYQHLYNKVEFFSKDPYFDWDMDDTIDD